MLKKNLNRIIFATTIVLAIFSSGCDSSDGPAEKTGEKVDNAVEATKEAMEETTDKITGQGPAEEVGEKIDETVESVKESDDSSKQ